jgi:signal transduction histidine kinase
MARRRSTRSWLLDIALAVLATLLGLFFVHESVSQDGEGAPVPVEAVAGVLSFLGLVFFRRSRPVALSLALIPFGIVLGMPMGATPIALFAVALHRPARVAIALAALHALATTVIYYLALGTTRAYYEAVAFLVLLHVSLVAVAMLIRSQRQLVASWAERARQAEEGQRLRIEQARLAERERIAGEMHDVLAHRLSLLSVHAGALEFRPDAPPEEIAEAAAVIRQTARDALHDLREVIGVLREGDDSVEPPQPTLDAIPALIEESRAAGMKVQAQIDASAGDALIGRTAYRVVQEGLTNARKHAPAAAVQVTVAGDEHLVVEVVSRRAAGARTAVPGAGTGLIGLAERVGLAGGKLEHGPNERGDFVLRATL